MGSNAIKTFRFQYLFLCTEKYGEGFPLIKEINTCCRIEERSVYKDGEGIIG